jgi:enoyl-CoA hydratase
MSERNEHLLVDRTGPDGSVLLLTMNRPEARNAFSLEMLAGMADAWHMLDTDDTLRVAVLTGGEKTFSSGADLKMMHGDQSANPIMQRFKDDPDLHWRAMMRNVRPKKPVIAAVEGIAFGGGTEVLQGTDIRVAGRSAKFALTEVCWGLFPMGGSTVRLRRQIPFAKAMDMLLTGRIVSAVEAEQWGLISRVVDDGQAVTEALAVAATIAANGPLAVQAIKRAVIEFDGLTETEALQRELTIGWPIFQTEDAKEGPRAFKEKRKAVFKGR